MSESCQISVAGQTLHLLPQRCAWWQERGALLLSDLHLGKSAAFRAAGLPIPEGHTGDDLARLDTLLAATAAAELIIVGDLFHAPAARSPEVLRLFTAWRRKHPQLTVRLIIGNHDHRALPPASCEVEILGHQWAAPPLAFIHDPADISGHAFAIAGHLHPAVVLPGKSSPRFKVPCFWMTPSALILPSFGGFTGSATIQPRATDRIFTIAENSIREVPASLWAARTARAF